jgi:hypothetical protein
MALMPMALVPMALVPAALGRVGLADTLAGTGSARILWSPAPRRQQRPDLQHELVARASHLQMEGHGPNQHEAITAKCLITFAALN